jgi:hypothetical protein
VYVESKSTSQQTSFDTKMSQIGVLSTVSDFDDYPVQYINFKSMDFPFYGTIVNSIAINPNAVIVLPPIKPCVSYIGYITVITLHYTYFSPLNFTYFKKIDEIEFLIYKKLIISNIFSFSFLLFSV